MSQRIPHLLTSLLTESECDALIMEMGSRAIAAGGRSFSVWMEAVNLINQHRAASLARRMNQTPSARRKSLGYRPALSSTSH